MSCLKLKVLKQAKSIQSNRESPINRSRVLGWADEVLSQLKSDRNFLRRTVKKAKYEDESANDKSDVMSPKRDKFVGEGISQMKPDEVTTCVSEIVTSKTKRKTQHVAFDGSTMAEKQKDRAANKEYLTNTEADENCEDQEGDLCGHEIYTRNGNKVKYNEGKHQNCFADNTYSESTSHFKDRPRKKNKVADHYRSHEVSCCHFCKCATKEIRSQKLKKCEMPKDFCSVNENDPASEKVEDATTCKQDKIKKLKHTLNDMLKGNQLSDRDIPKKDPKLKKKEKRYYTHSVSEECISEKKKLKKYKLYTEKYKSDESMYTSERDSKMSDREQAAFEGRCCLCERRKRGKHKHDHTFNKIWEETKNSGFWHCPCKAEVALCRNEQKCCKENSHSTVECKRKRKSRKDDAYIESELISERTKEHSDFGYYYDSEADQERKKKRKQETQSCKVCDNVSDSGEMGKKEIYSDKSVMNAMEASSIREKQKKKHKETEKYYNCSVDTERKNKKNKEHKTRRENDRGDDNLKTGRSYVNEVEGSPTQVKAKKKSRAVEIENYCNLSVDKEEGSKKKRKNIKHKQEENLNSDRNYINAIEASSIKEKENKHKAEKEKYYNLSVDIEEGSKKKRKKKRYEESAGTQDNLETDNGDVNAAEGSSVKEKRKKKHREVESDLSFDMQDESKKKRKKKRYEENNGAEDDVKAGRNDVRDSSVLEKQKKHKEAKNENICNLAVDIEEESKKKRRKKCREESAGTENNLKTDGNDIDAMGASSAQRKQKKKRKIRTHSSLSVDTAEEGKMERGKENVSTDNSLKTGELDGACNIKYSVKEQGKSSNAVQSQTEGMDSIMPKLNKDLSVVSKAKTGGENIGSAMIEDDLQCKESNQCPESTQIVSNFKENRTHYMQINASHDKNIKQSKKMSNFGLSPIFRLLATESDISNTIHTCQTCCRCKQHPDVARSENAGSLTENMGNVVIKIEPGVTIKQEKEDFQDSDPNIMDQQELDVKQESQAKLNTDNMNRTDDSGRNVEGNDVSIDHLTEKEEVASTGNGISPNEYSDMKGDMGINETDYENCIDEFVEDVHDESLVDRNKETDVDVPFHNMYDDKITVKEEIFHLTNVCYQSESRSQTEDTLGVNLDYVGKQTIGCVGNINELTSVGVAHNTYNTVTNVHRTASVQEVNGLNLGAVPKWEPLSLNEPENRFSLDVIQEAPDVQNAAWNGTEASSLYWSSLNGNEQQMSQMNDVGIFTCGRVNFTYVPKW